MQIRISVKRTVAALSIATVVFALLGAMVEIWTAGVRQDRALWLQLVDLDTEANLPTAFSVLMLASAAVLAGLIARRRIGPPGLTLFWWLSAGGLAVLSFDELLSLHNRMNVLFPREIAEVGIFRFRWVAGGLIAVAAAFAVALPLLRHLPRRTLLPLSFASVVYLAGALGAEMFAGYLVSLPGPTDRFLYSCAVVIEETLEMTGTVLLIAALLRHTKRELDGRLEAGSFCLVLAP